MLGPYPQIAGPGTSLFFNVNGATRDTDNNKLHNEKTPQPTKGQRYDRVNGRKYFYRAENVFGSLISGDTAENVFGSLIPTRFDCRSYQYQRQNISLIVPLFTFAGHYRGLHML
jgi:hypothetical protein